MIQIPNGVNCTMLVPYTPDNQIDTYALDHMVRWYHAKGCASLFAMCHSTEMHLLTMSERETVLRQVRKSVDGLAAEGKGRMPIIAAGTFSDDLSACLDSIQQIKEAGADAVVIVTNRLDPQNEGTPFRQRGEWLLSRLPGDFPLGLYECPMPYKRVMKTEELAWAAQIPNLLFLKDTCCDPDLLRDRLAVTANKSLRIFNANAQTLLYSLRLGAAGYSSVMANIHPQLYAWLCANYDKYPAEAERLQEILCFTSFAEALSYPIIAKYVMRQDGVPVELSSRMREKEAFTPYHQHIMDQLIALTKREEERLQN